MRNIKSIGCSTQFCCVIGNPIAHSLSPAIHNAAYAALDLDFVYVACRVEDVKSALTGMRALSNFRGMSVTIPHKIEAMKHMDEIRDVDRAIGSINTVVHEKDKLIGMGTDGPGALKAITDTGTSMAEKRVLMIGAGGAARMIAFTLARDAAVAELTLLDINTDLLNGLTDDLSNGTDLATRSSLLDDASLAEAMDRADIIIHCTSVGMHPNTNESLVPKALFKQDQIVFDIVYTPLETKLLADAKSRGLRTISGVDMFVNQAVLQFEQFTGTSAPVEVMRQVVLEHLQS